MVSKELLRQVLYEQRELSCNLGVEREIDVNWTAPSGIMVISGVRRCGKSVLMQQIRSKQSEQDYALSFDDDRLIHFNVDDFQLLYDVFMEDFGVQHTFYLDEPQLITGWERFVDRLEKHGNKIYLISATPPFSLRRMPQGRADVIPADEKYGCAASGSAFCLRECIDPPTQVNGVWEKTVRERTHKRSLS